MEVAPDILVDEERDAGGRDDTEQIGRQALVEAAPALVPAARGQAARIAKLAPPELAHDIDDGESLVDALRRWVEDDEAAGARSAGESARPGTGM